MDTESISKPLTNQKLSPLVQNSFFHLVVVHIHPSAVRADYGHSVKANMRFAEKSISKSSISVVKKPYSVARHGLQVAHKFLFRSDKSLQDGYAPKYRYLPIISGLIVPVRFISYTTFPSSARKINFSECYRPDEFVR